MNKRDELERRVSAMLHDRANDIPADLTTPPYAGLGLPRLARTRPEQAPRSRRRPIVLALAGVFTVIALVVVAVWSADDPPTKVIGIAPSTTITTTTTVAEALPTYTTVVVPSFDGVAQAPRLAPGEACPTTPITTLSPSQMPRVGQGQVAFVPYAWQRGDVALPARPYGAVGEIAVFWFAARDVGSILVRGYQLDGDDVMRFNNGPNDLEASVWVSFSQQGTSLDMPQGWVHEPDIWLYVNNSGCYAIDILGARGYRDRIIIKVART